MKKAWVILFLLGSLLLFGVCNSLATIVNGPDIGGFRTFRDQNTGRIWLDMDNFFNKSPTYMVAAAGQAGFTFATQTDVRQLLDTLSLTSGQFASYKQIMGYGLNNEGDEQIWGAWYYTDTAIGTSWASDWDGSWNHYLHEGLGRPWDRIPFKDTPYAIMNIWAYQTIASVPIPATAWLLGLGLVGLVGIRRKSRMSNK